MTLLWKNKLDLLNLELRSFYMKFELRANNEK